MDKINLSHLLEVVYSNNPLAVAIFDNEMRYLFASQQWYEQYHLQNKSIIGRCHYDVFPEFRGMPEYLEVHQRVLQGETLQGEKDRLVRQDGSIQYQRWIMRPWYYPDTDIQGGAYIYTEDISEQVKLEQDKVKLIDQLQEEIEKREAYEEILEHRATTDDLTGLYNRRHFTELLCQEMARVKRYADKLALFMIDVDHFKQVNDTYGHGVGDKILEQVSRLLEKNVRSIDQLCRWGGEEFIALLPCTGCDTAVKLAERLRRKVEKHQFSEVANLTISIGVTSYTENDTLDSIIKHADKALYMAKDGGRNQVAVYQFDEPPQQKTGAENNI
jgi:diguanylate cyclase (GGDEF)-like protein